jgi:hypothetical protein
MAEYKVERQNPVIGKRLITDQVLSVAKDNLIRASLSIA